VVLGDRSEAITAAASELHVETIDTQLGEVINGNKIAAVPLNGPRFTDLLALSPAWLPLPPSPTVRSRRLASPCCRLLET
jgi:hypothetical protein